MILRIVPSLNRRMTLTGMTGVCDPLLFSALPAMLANLSAPPVESRKKHKKHKKKSKGEKKEKKKRREREAAGSGSESEKSEKQTGQDEGEEAAPESEEAANQEEFKKMWKEKVVEDSVDNLVGPTPLPKVEVAMTGEKDYGKALMPGEGSAMAQYVQSGKRIPRRGEIGLESTQIEAYETVGFVMSGSRSAFDFSSPPARSSLLPPDPTPSLTYRHRMMNAVRIRKENQVISAEEKRALMAFNYEQRAKRENEVIANFRDIVSQKLNKDEDDEEGSS